MRQIEIIYINGKPGCGKDTQACEILKLFPNISKRISTGDIYRGAKTPEGEYGQYYEQIKPHIDFVDNKGGLVPDDIIVPIVKQVILTENKKNNISEFIFTGFPRTVGQLEEVNKMTHQLNSQNYFINYQLSDKISQQRAKHRREKCLVSGENIRNDDQPDVVLRRLKTFHQQTQPVLDKLKQENRLITIDASGTIEEIRLETEKHFHPK